MTCSTSRLVSSRFVRSSRKNVSGSTAEAAMLTGPIRLAMIGRSPAVSASRRTASIVTPMRPRRSLS